MAAVVRVKRRLEEEPSDVLLLSCKRRKIGSDDDNAKSENEELSAVLKFAGTIKEDESVLAHLKKQNLPELDELKNQFKKHTVNISDKLRAQKQELSKSNRYKIINCFRSQDVAECSTEEAKKPESEYTIYDIETDCNDNDSKTEDQNKGKNDVKYVYDLYYTNSDDFGDTEIEEYVSIYPLSDPLMLGSTRDNGLNAPDSEDDSEDSNAENNWRNDYPDESDLDSVDEDDMVEAMNKVDINEDLLSSDEGEEGFVYSIDSEAIGFEEDIDESDVFRYGERYAKFIAKYKKDVESSGANPNFYCGDVDEDEYCY